MKDRQKEKAEWKSEEDIGQESAEYDLEESIKKLDAELEECRQKSEEYLLSLQRERADFTNFRRQQDRNQEMAKATIKSDIVIPFLGIVDDIERALMNTPKEGEAAEWGKGVELIHRKLLNVLSNAGVEPIEVIDHEFDPNVHEAISHEDIAGHESGKVIEIVQQGYKLGDRVIRPARVRVAK